jgi:hypothetical protein
MLRLVLGLSVTVAALGLLRPSPCRPDPPRRAEKVVARGQLPLSVIGYGQTAEGARANALERAAEALADFLQQQDVPLLGADWKEDPATLVRLLSYVNAYVKDGEGSAGEEVILVPNQPPFKKWVLPLRARPDWAVIFSSEQAAQRQVRAHERQHLAGWLVTGLAGLLGLIAGGLRLERWSRGRYPNWLRAAVVGLLAALAAGLLVIA